ncbi:1,2-phenylacetyl-CoA epoxidase subunit PaaD [Streptomyces sp. NPDC006012]|uniref:1,2-phenylacetyl-CoA epoxidase subunit PaaD n=1 Tax=Streptomyces sp. NPDC006012 TaxID=3364739 RepID=UPI0036CB52E5
MVTTPATPLEAELLDLAGSVPDPELPVLTLRELGVVRAVHLRDTDAVEVELTPTYTGCPAIEAMSVDIERILLDHGMRQVTVRTVLTPAWSTDDITDEGRRKLHESGIAPPRVRHGSGPVPLTLAPPRTHTRTSEARETPGTPGTPGDANSTTTSDAFDTPDKSNTSHTADAPSASIRCPHCGSADTELLSRFSSTACKALRRCLACREPFDHFKEL